MSDVDVTAVAAWKGGVGKTTLAYELAYQLDAVLVDFDWDQGNATRTWGYRHEDRYRAPLLDAIDSGKTPTPLNGGSRKPDLVPCHPDFAVAQPEADELADLLTKWAAEWGRKVVADTHPGGNPSTYGAMAAARVVAVPVVFGVKDLSATEGMLNEVPDYPLLLVPSKVKAPSAQMRNRLRDMATAAEVPVASPIPYCSWIPERQLRIAITSEPVAKRAEPFTTQIRAVTDAVRQYS